MKLINPATEEVTEIEETSLNSIPEMCEKARLAQKIWAANSIDERIKIISNFSKLLSDNKKTLSAAITEDMGKPIASSLKEIEAVNGYVEYFCDNAKTWLANEEVESCVIAYQPKGVIGIISPWNYPLSVPNSSIVPSLIAGNAVIFKPSEHGIRIGGKIVELINSIPGIPQNLCQVIIGGKEYGKALVQSDVDMIAFTGSTAAGKHIMESSASKLHNIILELGGLDAAIVCDDADIEKSAESIVKNNAYNSGQTCCAIKRVFVDEKVYDNFVVAAKNIASDLSVGNPKEDVFMGPVVAKFQLEKIEKFVNDAITKGAKVETGGSRNEGTGFFFPPTILTQVNDDMEIMNDEPFGPILPIIPVKNWEEGIDKANSTRYGLAGSVWTEDKEKAKKVLEKIEVGVAGHNCHGVGPVGTPFGGVKQSGIGRVRSRDGMRAFCNTKVIMGL